MSEDSANRQGQGHRETHQHTHTQREPTVPLTVPCLPLPPPLVRHGTSKCGGNPLIWKVSCPTAFHRARAETVTLRETSLFLWVVCCGHPVVRGGESTPTHTHTHAPIHTLFVPMCTEKSVCGALLASDACLLSLVCARVPLCVCVGRSMPDACSSCTFLCSMICSLHGGVLICGCVGVGFHIHTLTHNRVPCGTSLQSCKGCKTKVHSCAGQSVPRRCLSLSCVCVCV